MQAARPDDCALLARSVWAGSWTRALALSGTLAGKWGVPEEMAVARCLLAHPPVPLGERARGLQERILRVDPPEGGGAPAVSVTLRVEEAADLIDLVYRRLEGELQDARLPGVPSLAPEGGPGGDLEWKLNVVLAYSVFYPHARASGALSWEIQDRLVKGAGLLVSVGVTRVGPIAVGRDPRVEGGLKFTVFYTGSQDPVTRGAAAAALALAVASPRDLERLSASLAHGRPGLRYQVESTLANLI